MLTTFALVLGLTGQVRDDLQFRTFAPAPPLGWNSWDCFGTSITEAQFKSNARVLHTELLPSGYNIATVDIQWYEPNATGFGYNPRARLVLDGFGRLQPAPNRFPSSLGGNGFGPLASWTHAEGLKFGIHLMRGIPRQAVEQNLPIFGTQLHARDIANVKSICDWNGDMYGVDMSRDGSQQYYNSVFRQIAEWGVDFVKVDDLSRPYDAHRAEIEAIRKAIDSSGRMMILSMSPGETPVNEHDHAASHANMWRISDDFWDSWPALHEQFARLKNWSLHQTQGAWPDADMLPLGTLANGSRKTNFSPDEQRTLMALWGIARSPLIIGADLTKLDRATLNLLKTPEVLRMNQHGVRPRWVSDENGLITWISEDSERKSRYVAVFNTRDPFTLSAASKLAESSTVSRSHPVLTLTSSLKGYSQVALVTTDDGDGLVFDHSVWLNPTFTLEAGKVR